MVDRIVKAILDYVIHYFKNERMKTDFKERIAEHKATIVELEKSTESDEVKNEKLARSAAAVLCGVRCSK